MIPENARTPPGAAEWRLLVDCSGDAAWNMAADEAMLQSLATGGGSPTLRFYSWHPPAVSIGYFQKANEEIDPASCASRGIGMVRRLTGGRAVLHDQEVTYSLVTKVEAELVPSAVTDSYLFFSRGLAQGLERLGIRAEMQPLRAARRAGKNIHASAACFDSPSSYEITVEGKKVIGSAQVRKDGVLLQHGSVLLSFRAEDMTALMRFSDEEERRRMTQELSERAKGLSEITGRALDPSQVVMALQSGIADQCGVKLTQGSWSKAEMALISELVENKYANKAWNWRI